MVTVRSCGKAVITRRAALKMMVTRIIVPFYNVIRLDVSHRDEINPYRNVIDNVVARIRYVGNNGQRQ